MEINSLDTFAGHQEKRITFWKHEHTTKNEAIVLLTGWAETFLKHTETLAHFVDQGYAVFTLDHRGQGMSEHLSTYPDISHVDSFDDFVFDLQKFVQNEIVPKKFDKVWLVAHSMGCLVGALHAVRFPQTFRGMALCSPMFGILTAGMPSPVLYTATWLGTKTGFAKEAMPFQPTTDEQVFERNHNTHSPARFQFIQQLLREHPETIIQRVSIGWVKAALEGTHMLRRNAHLITTPTLLFQAGNEKVVCNRAQDHFAQSAPHNKKIHVPEAFHELLMERDEIRTPVLQAIATFLSP